MTPDASPTSPSPGSRRRTGLVKCQGSRAVSAGADAIVSACRDCWYKGCNEHNQTQQRCCARFPCPSAPSVLCPAPDNAIDPLRGTCDGRQLEIVLAAILGVID